MRTRRFQHFASQPLLQRLDQAVRKENDAIAEVIELIAEVDERRLYVPEGYESTRAYCVDKLGFTRDAAYKRIQAARVACRIPELFEALDDGRLDLSGVTLLAAHLTPENAAELIGEAAGKSKAEIQALIARRFPKTELLSLVEAVPAARLAPGQVVECSSHSSAVCTDELAPGQVQTFATRSQVTPTSAESYALYVTIPKPTRELLRDVQALMSHSLPSGDVAEILHQALQDLKTKLERRKFAATDRPRRGSRRTSSDPRHVPAHVKRAVRERDGDRCTFVSETGHRCESRTRLEFDHIQPIARGGRSTVENLRLRCHAHNQHEAEQIFGAGFMAEKRAQSQSRVGQPPAQVVQSNPERSGNRVPDIAIDEKTQDLASALRTLRFRNEQIRRAIEYADPEATLEENVRAALRMLCPKAGIQTRVDGGAGTKAVTNIGAGA